VWRIGKKREELVKRLKGTVGKLESDGPSGDVDLSANPSVSGKQKAAPTAFKRGRKKVATRLKKREKGVVGWGAGRLSAQLEEFRVVR